MYILPWNTMIYWQKRMIIFNIANFNIPIECMASFKLIYDYVYFSWNSTHRIEEKHVPTLINSPYCYKPPTLCPRCSFSRSHLTFIYTNTIKFYISTDWIIKFVVQLLNSTNETRKITSTQLLYEVLLLSCNNYLIYKPHSAKN